MFNPIKITDLPAATDVQDSYELPLAESGNSGDVKKVSAGMLKSYIMAMVNSLLNGITQGPQGPAGAAGAQGLYRKRLLHAGLRL